MITYFTKYFKSIDQKKYNSFIEDIPIYKLSCSCGKSGCLTKHGYYNRNVKTPNGILNLRILRLICSSCGKTHAVFPICIVPYSQMILQDHLNIINTYVNGNSFNPIMLKNEYIDESNISYIVKQFLRHWKERLISFSIAIDSHIALRCLKTFKRQFMQIKCIDNILSPQTHIT